MTSLNPYRDFTGRLKLFASKRPELITTTLSNIFTARLIGNKTHGDLAEIGISEFINQYMYDFRSVHVGKDLYRAKSREEDISIINEISGEEFPVSLKAYGVGPLQLSTDKSSAMFGRLKQEGTVMAEKTHIDVLLAGEEFSAFKNINVLPLIYDEGKQQCNILVFDYDRALAETARISLEESGRGRKHPVYRFYNAQDQYICEVRYGGATANALQRGLWTHTKNGVNYFDSITSGWIDYTHNHVLVRLLSHALIASEMGHQSALDRVMADIERIREG